jgi:hypothetical protein
MQIQIDLNKTNRQDKGGSGDSTLNINYSSTNKMEEIIIIDKQQYLKEHYPFADIPELTDSKLCIHCDKIIIVGNYKVFKDKKSFEYICCPNAPSCDGTLIDWMEF